jgi:hypothetical protein
VYAFTHENGIYLVTAQDLAGNWRKLDGWIETHNRGHVVCITMHEPVNLEALQVAFSAWWRARFG